MELIHEGQSLLPDWLSSVKTFSERLHCGPLTIRVESFVCHQYRGAISIIPRRLLLGMAQNQCQGTSGEPPGMIHGRTFQRVRTTLRHQRGVHLIKNRLSRARVWGRRGIDFHRMCSISEKPYYTLASGSKVGREIAPRFIS